MIQSLYAYVKRRLPGPGAGNAAFLPTFALPIQQVQGPGISYARTLNPIQPVQVYHKQARTIIGQEGIISGTIYGQPLLMQTENGGIILGS